MSLNPSIHFTALQQYRVARELLEQIYSGEVACDDSLLALLESATKLLHNLLAAEPHPEARQLNRKKLKNAALEVSRGCDAVQKYDKIQRSEMARAEEEDHEEPAC